MAWDGNHSQLETGMVWAWYNKINGLIYIDLCSAYVHIS